MVKGDESAAIHAAINGNLTRARTATAYQEAQDELKAALENVEKLQGSDRFNMELIIWMEGAIIAEHANDLKGAVEYREKLIVRRPDNPTSHLALSRLYRRLGSTEEATRSLRNCEKLAEQSNDKSVLAVLAAKGYLPSEDEARARRLEEAVAMYREILASRTFEQSPHFYAVTQSNLGSLYRRQSDGLKGEERRRKLEEAQNAYREALRVHTAETFPEENRPLVENLLQVEELLRDRP